MKPYYEDGYVTIYHGDCQDMDLPPVDLVLTDPPWGIRTVVDAKRFTRAASNWWRQVDTSTVRTHKAITGDDELFDPAPFIQQPAILWGGHCFANQLPPSPGWLIWDKRLGAEQVAEKGWPLGEAELAWTNIIGATRVFRNLWSGLLRSEEKGEHYHPTQKPVRLMAWCIQQASKFNPQLILDPFLGSGTTAVAAKTLNRKCIGVEIEERYCEIAANRCRQTVMELGI
ncbi:hypothetical protein LCGC14_1909080 [marine sediment metagenome]|uniref:DNA methylase N-4/N-6 domain-containing protein n=1 Tax=marine sediment metagenome TaxID=412755 RepID=A0A0F9FU81_9ZZZZ